MLTPPILALLLGSGSALTQAAPAPAPLDLFRAACLDGSVNLPRDQVAPVEYRGLPRGARRAIGQSTSVRRNNRPHIEADPHNVPNMIYRVGSGGELFLMPPLQVPLQQPSPNDQIFHTSCMVVWRGDNFVEAGTLVLGESPGAERFVSAPNALPGGNPWGSAFISTTRGGLLLTASAHQGWIALRAAPEAPEVPKED